MDNFCEQIVSVKNSGKQIALKFVVILCVFTTGILIFFIASFYLNLLFGFVLSGAAIYLGLYLLSNTVFEYEYIFTNGELDIDKIIAKRKRKRIVSVEIRSISDFGKASEAAENKDITTKIYAYDGIPENAFYADFVNKKYGKTRMFFSPDEKLLKNMKPYLPRNLKNI